MNPMTDERRRDDMAWWQVMKAAYPYHAQAPTLDPSPSDFALSKTARHGGFDWGVIPAGDSLSYWAFSTRAARDAFLAAYPSATELAAAAVFGNPV